MTDNPERVQMSCFHHLENCTSQKLGLKFISCKKSTYVKKVKPWSEAANAGFRQGDRILTVNGRNIEGTNMNVNEVMRLMQSMQSVVVETIFDEKSQLMLEAYKNGRNSSVGSKIRSFFRGFLRNTHSTSTTLAQAQVNEAAAEGIAGIEENHVSEAGTTPNATRSDNEVEQANTAEAERPSNLQNVEVHASGRNSETGDERGETEIGISRQRVTASSIEMDPLILGWLRESKRNIFRQCLLQHQFPENGEIFADMHNSVQEAPNPINTTRINVQHIEANTNENLPNSQEGRPLLGPSSSSCLEPQMVPIRGPNIYLGRTNIEDISKNKFKQPV